MDKEPLTKHAVHGERGDRESTYAIFSELQFLLYFSQSPATLLFLIKRSLVLLSALSVIVKE